MERNRKIVARNPDHASFVLLWMPLETSSRVLVRNATAKLAHTYVRRRDDKGVTVAGGQYQEVSRH